MTSTTNNTSENFGFITSFGLHLIAITCMLLDHMWATVIPGHMWMTFVGRLAFPIFAFMIVEGLFHTHNLKKYMLRILIAAVISEVPFNLMKEGYYFDPFSQNVMWTLLLCLAGIAIIEKTKKKNKIWLTAVIGIMVVVVSYFLSIVLFLDCSGFGVLTVHLFYWLRGKKWWQIIGQIIGMYIINTYVFKGMIVDINLFGHSFEVMQQSFATLAMLPIIFYNGKQGYHNKAVQYCFYAFYPVHMLILSLIAIYVL